MPLNVCLINCAVGVAGFNRNWPNRRAACDREGSWIGHGIASVGAALAPNVGWLIVFRLIQGLGASTGMVSSRTTKALGSTRDA